MKLFFKTKAIALSLLFTFLFNCAAQEVNDITSNVERSIINRIEQGKYVSIFVAVVDSIGIRYYSYGSISPASRLKPDENSVYDIGSISKVYTTIILAEMDRTGELSLSDRIEKYLPENIKVPTRKGQSITLAHLATHTSGLPNFPPNFSPNDKSNPWADYSKENLMEFISSYKLTRDIGSEYEYSNIGFALLARILEINSGKNYCYLLQEYLADPLGLVDTQLVLTPSMKKRLLPAHNGHKEVPIWTRQLSGHGGIKTTPKELIKFISANMGLLKTPLNPAMNFSHQQLQIKGTEILKPSLGWEVRSTEDATIIYHDGSTSGYKSFTGFNTDRSKGVVVLTNSKGSIVDLGRHLVHPSFRLKGIEELIKHSGNN